MSLNITKFVCSHSTRSTCNCAARLFRQINMTQISRWELESLLHHEDHHMTRLILCEVVRQTRQRPHSPLPTPLVNSRGMELAVVKVIYLGFLNLIREIISAVMK